MEKKNILQKIPLLRNLLPTICITKTKMKNNTYWNLPCKGSIPALAWLQMGASLEGTSQGNMIQAAQKASPTANWQEVGMEETKRWAMVGLVGTC
jgi:hypothetical protein